MADRIELFANDGNVPVVPSKEVLVTDPSDPNGAKVSQHAMSGNSSLISKGVEEAISGHMVKSILIPETLELLTPNYVIDFREVSRVGRHQLGALTSLLSDDGDTAIYVCLSNGMNKLGMAVGASLDRVLPVGIQNIFNGKCTLYQDVEKGKPLREIKQQDVKKTRLRL